MNRYSSNSERRLLTKDQILAAPARDYMNEDQLTFFTCQLLELHGATLTRIREAKARIKRPCEASGDNDVSICQQQADVALSTLEREQKLLPKIRQALERIRYEEFGYCLASGEPIGIARLVARPTAEYCACANDVK